MPFRLSIHNLLGIWDADLTVDGVTLIAGPNGAGKTSILAVAASVMSEHQHIGTNWNSGVLHDPAREGGGVAVASFSGWSRRMIWPAGEVSEKGEPPRPSPVTTGAVPFLALDEKRRVAEIERRIRMDPSPNDLQRALVGFAGVDPAMGAKILSAALEHGWGALHAEADERLTTAKAEWKEITGADYVDRVTAERWHPASINPAVTYRMIDFDAEVMSIERRLLDHEVLARMGRADFDAVAATAATAPAAQRRLNEAVKAHAELEQEIAHVESRLFDYEGRGGEERQATCPCCGEPIAIALRHGRHKTWHLSDGPVTAGKKAQILVDRTRKKLTKLQGRVAAAAAEMADAQAVRHRAIEADTALRAMRRRDEDEQSVEELTAALLAAMGRRDDFKRWLRAQEIRKEVANSFLLTRALGPHGIRKRLIDDALLVLNRKLVDLCDQADLPKVLLAGDGSVTVGGRLLSQASESGRWVAEVMTRIAFALIEGSTFTTVPSLHTLQPLGRPPFFRMLKATGLDALVELTPKDRAAVPDLHRARIGQAYWIAGGRVEPC